MQGLPNRPKFAEEVKKLLCCYVIAIDGEGQWFVRRWCSGTWFAEEWAKVPINGGSADDGHAYLRFLTKRILQSGKILAL